MPFGLAVPVMTALNFIPDFNAGPAAGRDPLLRICPDAIKKLRPLDAEDRGNIGPQKRLGAGAKGLWRVVCKNPKPYRVG